MFGQHAAAAAPDASGLPASDALPPPPPLPLPLPAAADPLSPPAAADTPPPVDSSVYSLLPRTGERLPGHTPAVFDRVHACFVPYCTDYDAGDNFPPANCIEGRHRDLPAVFRDTFSNTRYWTAAQQTAIKTFFTGWDDAEEKHTLHRLMGNLITSSYRHLPVEEVQQNHTVGYYLDQLRTREPKASGKILYNVDIRKVRGAQSFRYGPEGLDLYQRDVYKASGDYFVELLVLAGMKTTWTTPHIDPGGDSTWSMLVEGSKVWLFGRPENAAAFITYFTKPIKWKQWSKEDRKFMADHRCIMIVQRAGDIIYVPHGWPHLVKHLTDTLAFNSSVLNGWLVADAIGRMDFDAWTQMEMEMFSAVRTFVDGGHDRVGMSASDVAKLKEVWDRKMGERQAKRRRLED